MIHADLLKRLLPPSAIDPGAPAISAELSAEGAALDLAAAAGDALLDEADPRTTAALLADWERVAGLPDGCVLASGITQSSAQRRAALVARITMQGGQSAAYFVALALSLGYVVTITEGHPHVTEHDTEDPATDELYRFIWYVNAALYAVTELTTEDDTEMATAVWGNTLLECVINRFKPAHTLVLFLYS
jgi:uncharacterized protein YmfQ (DUF2313 family)